MDPSLSVTSDPHHPPPFTTFPPFNNSNPFAAPNHPFYGGAPPPNNNNQFFQVPPQPQAPVAPPHPSFVHPPYSEMICTAIAALNEPDGSSKQAISRYMERVYPGIPPAHGALLTHHLRSLKANGILMMVKKSYKFAATPPPTSVAVAAAAASAGFEPPRSDFMSNTVNENQPLPDPSVTSPQTVKRGRGRPPKPKPDVQSQVQPSDVSQANGKPTWEQNEIPNSRPEEVIQAQPQPSVKRPPGRPRKDGASPTVKAASSSSGGVEIAKRRGRPPSGRAAGRERKPVVVSAPASVYPYVANGGVRRRGRPKRVDAAASSAAAVAPPPPNGGGQEVAGVVVAKRGRGRPPKVGGVIRKPMKLKRGYFRTGRPVGRPRKNVASKGASGQQAIGYGELKQKFELFQEKAKRVVDVVKAEMVGKENQAVVQAIQELEELTVTAMETTNEPQQHMEAMQPDYHHNPEGQGQALMQQDEHHLETEPEGEGQTQTEAEAMQEALF